MRVHLPWLQVDHLNETEYAKLPGPEVRLRCIDRCRLADADRVADPDPHLLSEKSLTLSLNSSTNAQQTLKLKADAQVCRACWQPCLPVH
jgi:hypothetical protein